MEHEVKTRLFPVLFHYRLLAVPEDRRLELNVAGFVNAVDIAECRGKEIPRALDGIQLPGNLKGILRSCIELCACLSLNAVLLSSDNSCFDFEYEFISLEPFQELNRNAEVLFERQGASIEHMAVEKVRPARCPTPFGLFHKRNDQLVKLVSLAVISVEGDVDRIPFSRAMHMFCDR